jgi:hypothetical protein
MCISYLSVPLPRLQVSTVEPLLSGEAPLQSPRQPLLPKKDTELSWEGFGRGSAKPPQTAAASRDSSLANHAGKIN